jgi:hypothetical protein
MIAPWPMQVPAAKSHAPDAHSLSFAHSRQSWLMSSQTGADAGQLVFARHTAQTLSMQTGVVPLQSGSPLQALGDASGGSAMPSGGITSGGRGKSHAASSINRIEIRVDMATLSSP